MPAAQDPIAVHAAAIVIDTHADTPQRFVDEHWNFTDPLNGGMLNYDSAKKGNLNAQFFSIWVDPSQYPANAAHAAPSNSSTALSSRFVAPPTSSRLCVTADDIVAAHKHGKFGVLIGIEGGHSIENSLGLLRDYYRLGVRYMTLTWSNSNDWADSSGDIDDPTVTHHNGLTAFGKQVIAEMNRLGMMVDVSHVSDKTFWDVLEITKAPIIASHSSARAITQAPRNLTDDMLRAIAKNNGVVMVNFYPAFIDEHWRKAWNDSRPERQKEQDALEAEYNAKGEPVPFHASDKIDRKYCERIGRAPFDSLIAHFDHVIKVAGIDHVGIGTDFDGIPDPPAEIDSAADLPENHRRPHGSRLHRRGDEKTPRRQSAPRLSRRTGRAGKAARHRTRSGSVAPKSTSPSRNERDLVDLRRLSEQFTRLRHQRLRNIAIQMSVAPDSSSKVSKTL